MIHSRGIFWWREDQNSGLRARKLAGVDFGLRGGGAVSYKGRTMFRDFINNATLVAAVASWLVAQFIKLFTFAIREKKFDYGFLFRLGGMPSSHTASAAACAMSVGLREGMGSAVFAVAMGMLALIMIDAQSVRRAAGVQARLLNQMAEEFYRDHKFSPEKMVEFLGHTRLEVFLGALLGITIALLIHGYFPVWALAR